MYVYILKFRISQNLECTAPPAEMHTEPAKKWPLGTPLNAFLVRFEGAPPQAATVVALEPRRGVHRRIIFVVFRLWCWLMVKFISELKGLKIQK